MYSKMSSLLPSYEKAMMIIIQDEKPVERDKRSQAYPHNPRESLYPYPKTDLATLIEKAVPYSQIRVDGNIIHKHRQEPVEGEE